MAGLLKVVIETFNLFHRKRLFSLVSVYYDMELQNKSEKFGNAFNPSCFIKIMARFWLEKNNWRRDTPKFPKCT